MARRGEPSTSYDGQLARPPFMTAEQMTRSIAMMAVTAVLEASMTPTTSPTPAKPRKRSGTRRSNTRRASGGRRTTRKPRKSRGRRWRVLRALADFVYKNAWLPSAPELADFVGRGSRWTMWRDLRALVRYGYTQQWRRCWAMTGAGWRCLGETPVYHRFDRRPPKSYHDGLLKRFT